MEQVENRRKWFLLRFTHDQCGMNWLRDNAIFENNKVEKIWKIKRNIQNEPLKKINGLQWMQETSFALDYTVDFCPNIWQHALF